MLQIYFHLEHHWLGRKSETFHPLLVDNMIVIVIMLNNILRALEWSGFLIPLARSLCNNTVDVCCRTKYTAMEKLWGRDAERTTMHYLCGFYPHVSHTQTHTPCGSCLNESFQFVSPYPAYFRGPWHHDGVGDRGGQPHQRGDVDGPTGPFWFHSVFGWREISLQ